MSSSPAPSTSLYVPSVPYWTGTLSLKRQFDDSNIPIATLAAFPQFSSREEEPEVESLFSFSTWPAELVVMRVAPARDTIIPNKDIARIVIFRVVAVHNEGLSILEAGHVHTVGDQTSCLDLMLSQFRRKGLAALIEMPDDVLCIVPHKFPSAPDKDLPLGIFIPNIEITQPPPSPSSPK